MNRQAHVCLNMSFVIQNLKLYFISIVTALQNYIIAAKIYLVLLFNHFTPYLYLPPSTCYCYETSLKIIFTAHFVAVAE